MILNRGGGFNSYTGILEFAVVLDKYTLSLPDTILWKITLLPFFYNSTIKQSLEVLRAIE